MERLKIGETKVVRRDATVELLSIKEGVATVRVDGGEGLRFVGGGNPAQLRSWQFKRKEFKGDDCPVTFPTFNDDGEAIFEIEKGDVLIADCVRYVVEWNETKPYLRY